ncbi:MAG TPA: KpsF/GutQ family sugar-phosphate isomerase [Gammaproteobacteria bacterium]|nr:KpsF/GutQ family sugar-phosphate isomerase [Gammaproteobacteria bacterium]
MNPEKFYEFGQAVIDIEARAVMSLRERIDTHFAAACEQLLACQGRIAVTGMGKSGHIARKIAATFASTGSPAFFIHAAEANHGDLGMIAREDIVLAISNSGETAEIINILPLIKRLNIPLICLSGKRDSTLAKAATVYINTSISEEACPLGLAPTSSTTATLVMGDALAISLLQAKGFTAQDFALYHPGGQLGRRLLLRIADVMRTGNFIPKIHENAGLDDALIEMTQKSLGMTTIVDGEDRLLGIYTDGDLRRTLNRGLDVHTTQIKEVMTPGCKSIPADKLANEALHIMETFKITALTVTDDANKVIGVVHMHDLLSAGLGLA